MVDKNTIIKVTNRDNGSVGYYIQDLDIRRDFMPGETKEVTMEELQKLHVQRGGPALLRMCLVLDNKDAIKELLGEVEPEYFYNEKDIKNLLLNGSIEQFLDCLDFAPSGVIDLIKDLAVKLEISDIRKRDAIKTKTGFDVTKAIEINHETEDERQKSEEKIRRAVVLPANNEGICTRRSEPPKYKIVEK